MMNVETCREAFAEKLKATGDMDAAFVKAVWVAFKAGIAAERAGFAGQLPPEAEEDVAIPLHVLRGIDL